MLTHPTLDQLQALGLHGMARAFAELAADPTLPDSPMPNGSALLLDRETTDRSIGGSRLVCAMRGCATRPRSRMSITAPHAGSIASSSRRSPAGDWIEQAQNLIIEGPTEPAS